VFSYLHSESFWYAGHGEEFHETAASAIKIAASGCGPIFRVSSFDRAAFPGSCFAFGKRSSSSMVPGRPDRDIDFAAVPATAAFWWFLVDFHCQIAPG